MASFSPKLALLLAALLAASTGAGAPPKKKPAARTAAKAAPAPATPPLTAPGELPLWAEGAIVIDGLTGKALYEKNADARYYPASTTKVMTALLIIEAGNLEAEVEVAEEDTQVGESGLDLKLGERYTRQQMLHGLMLKSANDVAHALARDNAGTVAEFGLKMTLRAKELGAANTNFRNPHGLHHAEHYTTARDLAAIARAAMQQPFFRKIIVTPKFDWPSPEGPRLLPNRNKLLAQFPGATGVKTGYTNPAQHTFVGGALRGGREVISVVLRDSKQGKWDDSMLLLSYGLERAAGKAETVVGGN